MNWREYFLGLAEYVSRKSKDTSTRVGAVAIGPDREVLETGYNGPPRGVLDTPERFERPAKYLYTAHAEQNLVASAARPRLKGSTVYVTHLCCCECAKALINAGVAKVICGPGTTSMPRDMFIAALEMFNEAGVTLEITDGPTEMPG